MIREYIDELVIENNEKLKSLEQQLRDLMDELNSNEKWLETLQSEEDVDKNLFSPRALDNDLKEKIGKVQLGINKTKQDIEYVKSFIETHLVKKQEYDKLLAELDEMYGYVQEKQNREVIENEQKEEHFVSGEEKSKQETLEFLMNLYKKTEFCLDSLYNDRIKCKSELKNMKTMIQKMIEMLKEDIQRHIIS